MVAMVLQSPFVLILGAAGLLLPATGVAHEPGPPARTGSRGALPLSTEIVPNKNFGFFRVVPKTAHWNGQEFDIETGIQVLMTVIKDPATTTGERALALRSLAHLNTQLRGNPCIDDLVALYPRLETTEERYQLLLSFITSDDARALPLVYGVASSDAQSRLRHRAAAALAQWNIRRGVEVLIALFPNKEKGLLRTRGAAALMTFERFNRTGGWGCPVEEIMKPATVLRKQDDDAGIALAIKGFREWFDANEHRFPDWKPGDPLPEAPKEKPTPEENK